MRAATDDDLDNRTVLDEATFLEQIRKLAVKSQNTLVAKEQLLNVWQDRGDNINS